MAASVLRLHGFCFCRIESVALISCIHVLIDFTIKFHFIFYNKSKYILNICLQKKCLVCFTIHINRERKLNEYRSVYSRSVTQDVHQNSKRSISASSSLFWEESQCSLWLSSCMSVINVIKLAYRS